MILGGKLHFLGFFLSGVSSLEEWGLFFGPLALFLHTAFFEVLPMAFF
jgi:hypothetical protein